MGFVLLLYIIIFPVISSRYQFDKRRYKDTENNYGKHKYSGHDRIIGICIQTLTFWFSSVSQRVDILTENMILPFYASWKNIFFLNSEIRKKTGKETG